MKLSKKYASVAVSETTRMQLNELKGTHSVDEYLSNVLTYLKLYRIDPMRRDVSPNQDVYNHYNDVMKRTEDVIKIIRSFEKGMKEMLASGSKTEVSSGDTQHKILQMQQTIVNLREEMSNNGSDKTKERLMRMYQNVIDFVEKNTEGDGSLFVGRARTNQFKESLKEMLNG